LNMLREPILVSQGEVLAEVRGGLGLITLNRPQALNALSLAMIRDITAMLLHWQNYPAVKAVLVQGTARPGKAPAFCAGGDIRFFHRAALAGDPALEDFFTEEYALNHLIHTCAKPIIALMDGVCMGGGMGISQGARLRVVTEHSTLAMPETNIGLFPDVGGGWFMARLAGALGEYLALTGHPLQAADAIAIGWADVMLPAALLPTVLEALGDQPLDSGATALATVRARAHTASSGHLEAHRSAIDHHFSRPTLQDIADSLAHDMSEWAQHTLHTLRQRSPLMMAVTLEQVRRARSMSLADELRMERGMVRHCFALLPGAASETVEGIRALAVDKDHHPRWNPARIEDVQADQVQAFFAPPWPAHAHPLRALG
jgi:enoyl-CoA hydratase/carnithine racemase